MARFKVTLERIKETLLTTEVEVSARNENDAKKKALYMVETQEIDDDCDWEERDCEYQKPCEAYADRIDPAPKSEGGR